MHDASWWLFVLASLAVIATPGQDMILVMSRSLAQGTAAGLATAAGVSVGLLGHTVLATAGLGAVLQASDTLFTVLKLVGAAYLLYLGVGLLRTPVQALQATAARREPLARLFVNGALSNLSNPKIIVFYFAFLPQFVHPDAQHPTRAIFALGAVFAALTFAVKAPVGYFAGQLSGWLRQRPQVLTGVYRSSGAILIALGVKLALERRA